VFSFYAKTARAPRLFASFGVVIFQRRVSLKALNGTKTPKIFQFSLA
jgi:hypothetical protein